MNKLKQKEALENFWNPATRSFSPACTDGELREPTVRVLQQALQNLQGSRVFFKVSKMGSLFVKAFFKEFLSLLKAFWKIKW